ncbi:MAG: thymidine phosphorylase [Anaerolineae bacterium]
MRAVDIIAKKRDGQRLAQEEIDFFVQGYTRGDIPDYQAAAFLMAIFLRGMDAQETIDLTLSMVRSGEVLDLSDVATLVADKHSSGGVGDKTTLVAAPITASFGIPVGKMSGRGLSFSGGTLDKLESFPGFRAQLSIHEFKEQLRKVGLVVAGQTAELAPADGKFYALRDVTATVPSLPLIASSIMSKKIAAGANVIVLDVKVGKGSFLQTEQRASELGNLMLEIGRSLGRKMAVVISNMDQPLGNAVGNALEVREAMDTLRGEGPADFTELACSVAGWMIYLSGKAPSPEAARAMAERSLERGDALAKFRDFIAAQGGDASLVDQPNRLPRARIVRTVKAPQSGYIAQINAMEIGMAAVLLGAGRSKKGDPIDHSVGIVLGAKVGDYVSAGDPLFTLHANDETALQEGAERVLKAYSWSEKPVPAPPLIKKVLS